METHRNRHRLRAQVRDFRLDVQHPVLQAMSHFNRVSKRKLLHPGRLLEKVQSGHDPRGRPICFGLHQLPRCGRQKAVDRNGASNITELHVERVSLPVRIERLLIEPVRPRSKERNAAQRRPGLELFNRRVRQRAEGGKMRHDSSPRPLLFIVAAIGALALTAVSESLAQGRGSAQTWWVAKTKGGVYNPPMRPIWRKADLVRTHAGQNIWS